MAFANRSAAHFDNGNFSASIAGIKREGHGTMTFYRMTFFRH